MNRLKLFVENFLVYGIGGVISKIIPLVMLPVVTRLMPNTEYFGINDISVVIVSFGSAIAIMGMYDAMYRMFFEKSDQEYKKEICSSALGFTVMTSIIVFLTLIIFKSFFASLFFGAAKYKNLLALSAMSVLIGGTNSIISAPTRMQNQRKVFLITNTLSPILSYGVSIPLLLKGYYIFALPLASVISAFSIEIIFGLYNRKWFSIKRIKKEHIKNMLIIGLPLLPNVLIYWIFNSSDRLMISHLLGNTEVGIYAIGSKIGQISQLIYTAFAGGWQYFAFATMKDNDQVKMTSNIFEYLGIISFSVGVLMAAMSSLIFRILFVGEYQKGEIIAPYLFIAPLLLMLFQVGGNQFLVIKKTWISMIVLSLGAIVNVIINLVLIPVLGIEGAAIGTLMGYCISVVLCVKVLDRMKLLKLSNRFMLCTFVTVLYGISWRLLFRDNILISLLVALICVAFYVFQYRTDISMVLKKK